jgi:hypothetical protein
MTFSCTLRPTISNLGIYNFPTISIIWYKRRRRRRIMYYILFSVAVPSSIVVGTNVVRILMSSINCGTSGKKTFNNQ